MRMFHAIHCVAPLAIAICLAAPVTDAWAGTIYEDSFSYSGSIDGVAPDVQAAGGNTWSTTNADPVADGSQAVSGGSNWSAGFLPVNGSSGVVLDGTADFVVSFDVVVLPGGSANIRLDAAPGDGYFDVTVCPSVTTLHIDGAWQGSQYDDPFFPCCLGFAYDSSAGEVSVLINGTPDAAIGPSSVTPSEIAALTAVGFRFEYAYAAPTETTDAVYGAIDNFQLAVMPEPASLALVGMGMLVMLRRRH